MSSLQIQLKETEIETSRFSSFELCYIMLVKNSYMNINVNLPLYLISLVDPSIYIEITASKAA